MSINHQLYASQPRSRLGWLAVGAVVVVMAAAATWLVMSGHAGRPSASSGFPPSAGSPPPSGLVPSSTSARLAAGTIQPTDLSASWTAVPYTPDPSDAATQAALVACVGGRNTAPDQTGEAHSPHFDYQSASIGSDVTSFRSQADIAADIAILHSSKIDHCFEKYARRTLAGALPAGATIDALNLAVTPRTDALPANVSATLAGRITVSGSGKTATIYLSTVFIVGPRLEAEIDFANTRRPQRWRVMSGG